MKWLMLMCVSLAVGCAGRGTGGTGGGSGGSGGAGGSSDQLNADELDTSDRGGDSSNGVQQLSTLADSLFDFDPTIDAQKTANENAQAIEQRVMQNIGSSDGGVVLDGGAVGCGSVSLSTNTVTVSFGAAPGCKLKNGVQVSGTVAVSVTKVLTQIRLSLTMTNMTVNTKPLAGTATFSTTNGSGFTVDCDVTSGSSRYVATNFGVTGTAGAATFNGSVSQTVSGVTTSLTFNTVVWNKADCYPSSGTMQVRKAGINLTITFSAMSATTGKVAVDSGRIMTTTYLPAYGTCGVRDGG